MKKVLVLECEDWEMLYIDGKLICEGHTLNEGMERVLYFLDISNRYEFDLKWIEWKTLNQEDYDIICQTGRSPIDIKEFKGEY